MLMNFFKLKYKEKSFTCPHCGEEVEVKYGNEKYHRVYLTCGHYINPLKGTIFYKTRINLTKLWAFLKSFHNETRTSNKVARNLGVSTSTAWRLLNKVRSQLEVENKTRDTVWIDETFFGSPKKYRRQQKLTSEEMEKLKEYGISKPKKRKDYSAQKHVLFGIAYGHYDYNIYTSRIFCQDAAELKAFHFDSWKRKWIEILTPLKGKIKNVVHDGDPSLAKIIIDLGFKEYNVKHSKNQYVKIQDKKLISTNIIEGFFGRLKRIFKGSAVWAKSKYCQQYLDEFSWRSTGKRYETQISTKRYFKEFLLKIMNV